MPLKMEVSHIDRSNCMSPHTNYMQQYVEEVLDFTSQYGSGGSISYTAHNLVGKPQIFPSYGDFPQAYVMRTYGHWWEEAPSGKKEICPQNFGNINGQDYIDLYFEYKVYPVKIYVYETYNPGAIVRIWAYDGQTKWNVLWESLPVMEQPISRIFSPKIKTPNFPTNILRLEFDLSHLDYYPEFDAVLMTGSVEPTFINRKDSKEQDEMLKGTGKIMKQILSLNLHQFPPTTTHPSSSSGIERRDSSYSQECHFDKIPYETVLKIFSYLDLKSLCQCCQVCNRFLDVGHDSSLYTEVNLKPYWSLVSPACLSSMALHCERLTALDVSWCGACDVVKFSESFIRFITDCGKRLKVLRLDSCKFVTNECLLTISKNCLQLQELSLRNVSTPRQDGWRSLSELIYIEHLDVYHSSVHISSILHILPKLPDLLHINLGSCTQTPSMDLVAESLANHNLKLISVDMWRTYSLSAVGLRSLACLKHLEEIELGWCGEIESPGESLREFAEHCPKLRKLFIAALRGVADRDIHIFIDKCPLLEQVDLLGARNITPDICLRLLTQCRKLRLLDLSFCEQILEVHVMQWRALFPYVSIKHSFSPDLDSDN